MTVNKGATPVIDLNTIRSILYLGLKGDVTLSSPGGPEGKQTRRTARTTDTSLQEPARRGGVDTWA